MVALVITTVQAESQMPLIEHRFFGRTTNEAYARYQTHLQADAFLRACGSYDVLAGGAVHDYNGTPCRSSWRWEPA